MAKIPKKHTKSVTTALMALGMSGVMSFSLGSIQNGVFTTLTHFHLVWGRALLIAVPTAFILSAIVGQINKRIICSDTC